MMANDETLLDFFRVMGNTDRLRIAGLLAGREHTAAELADALALKTRDVIEHLAALRWLGLVAAQVRGSESVYAFDSKALEALNRRLLSREALPTPLDHIADEEMRAALRPFFQGQRIMSLPTSHRKFDLLIKWLATNFENGVRYTEQDVNAIIRRYHDDYATLRRALIDAGLMQRERGVYWRTA